MTLKPLLRLLRIHDDDPGSGGGARTVVARRSATLDGETSSAASSVRQELSAHLTQADVRNASQSQHGELHRRALQAAREEVLRMRATKEIGDDAFHQVEEDLDWLEMAGGTTDQGATSE